MSNTCSQRSQKGKGAGVLPPLIPRPFPHSGLDTKEGLEEEEDLQAKICQCWQVEARHVCIRTKTYSPVCSTR